MTTLPLRTPSGSAEPPEIEMTLSMNVLRSGALGLIALAVLPFAGACGSQGGSSGGAPQSSAPSADQNVVQIDAPKDAKGVPLCNLLPPQAAQSLRLEPQGTQEDDSLNPDQPPFCTWRSADGFLAVSLSVLDRNIERDYYAAPQTWGSFNKLNVAGYPAVQANQSDPNRTGFCDIYLATQENQMIASQVSLPSPEVGKTDGCQIAQQALEAAVSTLPAAQ